ncbi:glycosyltransferase family 2 protein [Patescibacteria group bacterium]|nr:glycosyltransferase family 2 protein [Patescibacteria group bacterium]MBU0963650.1 glycosyltransferase family 2 protein [Patescibacteria group bacterium]
MLDLSIVIVNYNSRGLLRQCLKSLLKNLAQSDLQYKVVVVDNSSRDGSVEMVRESFANVRLIPLQENKGYAKGVNIGIKSIECRYYLVLNMDTTIVQDRAIERMVAFMDTHNNVGLAGPKLINPNGTTQVSCCTFPKFQFPMYRRMFIRNFSFAKKSMRDYLMLDWDHKSTIPVDWVIGTGMIIRNEAIKQVGLMDERFFMYFEDVDWCRRFWDSDWHVYYISDIEIVHYYSRDSAKRMGVMSIFKKQTRIHIISWLKYFIKYIGREKVNAKQKTK